MTIRSDDKIAPPLIPGRSKLFHFRDFLCTQPEHARVYSQLKEALAKKYGNNSVDYTEGKTDFVNGII